MGRLIVASSLTPLAFGFAFVAVTVVRSVWLRRTAGVNAYVIDHRDPVHRFVAVVFAAVVGGLITYFVVIAISPRVEEWFGRLDWIVSDTTRWISIAAMGLATTWTGWAQFSMGNSWRIGIPQGDAPPLRTNGLFAVSRNPIFLGMLAFVCGMTLWSPSTVTVALLVATYIALEVQIRGEEAFLASMHGEAYRNYCARVRRWF
jgi:protein-S-isoprenylcysteine O-methyltransferase Ste14